MQPIKVRVCIDPTKNNDFYLQWDYIFWWQMRFNMKCMMTDEIEEVTTCVNV